jgi:hypothetical protein
MYDDPQAESAKRSFAASARTELLAFRHEFAIILSCLLNLGPGGSEVKARGAANQRRPR